MEVYFALIIPIVLGILSYIIWHKKLTWWELVLPLVVSLAFIFGTKSCMVSNNLSDTEYLSTYASSASYEEPWNEYIHKTCTRTYACGTYTTSDSKGHTSTHTKYCTETYDCSYVEEHGPEWYVNCANGQTYTISQEKYNSLVKAWNNSQFIDMHRNYYSKDGDKYTSKWNNDVATIYTCTWTQQYENRVQASHSIYNFNEISDKEKLDNKLFDYPNQSSSNNINPILTHKLGITQREQDQVSSINGYLGAKKKVHVWILIWENASSKVSDVQQSYWKGGNKNELVICIGVDKLRNVKWHSVFTWSDKQIVKINTRNYLNIKKDKWLDFKDLQTFLMKEIDSDWVMKDWRQFDFLEVELTDKQMIWLYIITILVTLGSLAFGIFNEIDPTEHKSEFKHKAKLEYKSIMNWIRKRLGINQIELED